MSKVLTRWVPWLLTPDQKLTRLVMSKANLARFEADSDRFVGVFSPKMNVGSITLHERPKGNPCSGSTQLLLQKKPNYKIALVQLFKVRNYLSSIRFPKKISQSVSKKHEFNTWQVSLICRNSFIVRLRTFQPILECCACSKAAIRGFKNSVNATATSLIITLLVFGYHTDMQKHK